MRIGLVGLGAIGRFLIRALNQERVIPDTFVVAALDERGDARLPTALGEVDRSIQACARLVDFAAVGLDVVVEAASKSAAADLVPRILRLGIPVVVCSSGCLAESVVREAVEQAARAGATRCYVPAGAIGGLDLVQAAAAGGLERVTITTRKPGRGFGLEAGAAAGPTVLFEGSAAEAIERYPANVNSSVALSLSGLGSERTQVRIVMDPGVDANTHHIQVQGQFGRAELTVENHPLPDNPKTSRLAALSVIALIRSLTQPIHVGI